MYHCLAITFISVMVKITIHQNVQTAENPVGDPEKHAKKRHRDRSPQPSWTIHRCARASSPASSPRARRAKNFAGAWGSRPASARAPSAKIRLRDGFPRPGLFALHLPSARLCSPSLQTARQFRRPSKTGRGGGIRTPTLGFGDRWSTVEPTPLNFRASGSKIHPEPAVQGEG